MLLNVRDRRVEARIAYVGPLGAGRATNLVKLGASPTELATDWRPPSGSRFRDCDVVVKLAVASGAGDLGEALRDVDGVVFVADADPDALERNREAMAATRAALAARKDVAVVVQVNKRDLSAALSPQEVLAALDAESLPHVEAAAARGEGVIETAERALGAVLEASAAHAPVPPPDAPVKTSARGEGNPLLSALQKVLRDTVTEHVAALKSQAPSASADAPSQDSIAELVAEVRALRAAVDGIAAREARTQERVETIHAVVADLGEDMKRRKWGWFR